MDKKEIKTGQEYQLEKPIEETVLYEKVESHIVKLTLNRPEKGNALYPIEGFEEIAKKVKAAEADDDVKVIILRGAGENFCTGDDLNRAPFEAFGATRKFRPPQSWRIHGIRRMMMDVYRTLIYSEKTIIAQIHGWAAGAGTDLVLMSDLALAAEDAQFANYQMRIGFAGFPPYIAMMAFLTLGPKRYREWYLTGRTISAEKALEWGVVNEVVPREKLEERTLQWAETIASHSTDGLMIGKTMTHILFDLLGMHGSFTASNIAHPLFTNVKWRDDEFNFLKVRSEEGASEAFRRREDIWGKYGF